MKKFCYSLLMILPFLFLNVDAAFAQHIFLKAGELTAKGSLIKGYENYIEITGVQFGAEAESSYTKGGGASVGKPSFDVISITKNVDKLSNELLKNIAAGKSIPLIEIATTARPQQGSELVVHKIELKNVFVTKISDASAGCDDCGTLAESVSFVYKAIRITTYSQDAKTGVFSANPNPFELDIPTLNPEF
ncbi:type VI secretion system tube protein Hcp [Dyadobacter subterraneus]|uniref:Type VI secretion system tube protein Hcp n=1 Tax=Dyadobacter subterraneus TaxID=2773304 RepID=A0ABR9WG21_9BACT|nr:type VI secretion system tube protein Hcp [Dyadobacter subterraneus]MBE9463281.1 type VI secretion system tube protein Hcp [Dyadobacter subterraneus]